VILNVCYLASAVDTATKNLVAEGNIQYRQLKFAEALEKYNKAIESDSKYDVAYNNKGLALHKLGKLDEAAVAISKAIELDNTKASFYLNLGKIHATAGRYDLALDEFRKSLELDPKMASAVYNQAWVLDEQKDFIGAEKAVEDLQKMDKNPPGTKMLIGIVYAHNGDANALATACLESDDLPQLWRWLADLNYSLATGGLEGIYGEAQIKLYQAMRMLSTEQFSQTRDQLVNVAAMIAQSPLPHWLTAMAWQMEDKKDEADKAMKKAEPFMSRLSMAGSGERMELYINEKRIGEAPVTISYLPGVYLIGVIKSGKGGLQVFVEILSFKPASENVIEPSKLSELTTTVALFIESLSHKVYTPSNNASIEVYWEPVFYWRELSKYVVFRLPIWTGGYSIVWDQLPDTEPDEVKELDVGVNSTSTTIKSDGSYYFHIRAADSAGNWSESFHAGPFVIDTTPPVIENVIKMGNYSYKISAQSDKKTIEVTWKKLVADKDEIAGYSIVWDQNPTTEPDKIKDLDAETTNASITVEFIVSNSLNAVLVDINNRRSNEKYANYYFHIRVIDSAGNWSKPVHFLIDSLIYGVEIDRGQSNSKVDRVTVSIYSKYSDYAVKFSVGDFVIDVPLKERSVEYNIDYDHNVLCSLYRTVCDVPPLYSRQQSILTFMLVDDLGNEIQYEFEHILFEKSGLFQNYPNPCTQGTWIPYTLAKPSPVKIEIYNTIGQLIRTLQFDEKQAGVYFSKEKAVYWDGKNEIGEMVSNGIYFYTINTQNFSDVKKMVILR
jgi:tetratricopeptide (TPR) repeat protein